MANTRSRRRTGPLDAIGEEIFEIPHMALALTEPVRALVEFNTMLASVPWLATAPRGDGHALFVLPGLMASDSSTIVLRNYLELLGYRVYGWHLGRNVGPTAGVVAELPAAVDRISKRNRCRISIVGWSLGGIYARNLSQQRPDQIRQVITLGSPYKYAVGRTSRAHGTFERFSHLHALTDEGEPPSTKLSSQTTPMPSTSVYSKLDGVVSWQQCIEPMDEMSENIRVHASHIGMGVDPLTLWAIADRLAQPEGEWRRFTPPLWLRPLYPQPDDPQRSGRHLRVAG